MKRGSNQVVHQKNSVEFYLSFTILWTNEAIVVIEFLVSVGIAASSKCEAQEVAYRSPYIYTLNSTICLRTHLSPSKNIGGKLYHSYCNHLYSCGDSLVVLFHAT